MKAKNRATAQRMLNLYRQQHVIIGGWAAVNQVFVDEATDAVLQELMEMPTGKNLVRHIENLRQGITPMDTIDRELLPYGGTMSDARASINLTEQQWTELEQAINNFVPNQDGLDEFIATDIVRKFGEEWQVAISSLLQTKPHLRDNWATINHTFNAYRLWNSANMVISTPLTERTRAQVQSDMPEYETYLPMFGDAGAELLSKLRTFISTVD
jgi:hypothetical protein